MQEYQPAPNENAPLIGFFIKQKPRMLSKEHQSIEEGKLLAIAFASWRSLLPTIKSRFARKPTDIFKRQGEMSRNASNTNTTPSFVRFATAQNTTIYSNLQRFCRQSARKLTTT